MEGYKIKLHQNKFIIEEVEEVGEDTDLIRYRSTLKQAEKLATILNSHNKEWYDLKDRYDFVIRECKDCGRKYIIRKSEFDWCERKNAHIPVRCHKCRKKKHRKHFSEILEDF